MSLAEWYVARAGGIVAFVLLTLSVAAGLALSGRARFRSWPRFAVEDVHGYLGVLAGWFIAVHGLALLVDGYMPFSLAQLLVPFTDSYRPLATAAGIVSAELLGALALTNRFRKQIGHRRWRRAHYLNFVVWVLALAHGLFAGSDSDAGWAMTMYLASTAAVAALLVWRVLNPPAVAYR
jgi:predicted ferric reductase